MKLYPAWITSVYFDRFLDSASSAVFPGAKLDILLGAKASTTVTSHTTD